LFGKWMCRGIIFRCKNFSENNSDIIYVTKIIIFIFTNVSMNIIRWVRFKAGQQGVGRHGNS